MTAKQAYDVWQAFRDGFLSANERELAPEDKQNAWKKRLIEKPLSGHDAGLDSLMGAIGAAAGAYASNHRLASHSAMSIVEPPQQAALAWMWQTIEHAKEQGDDTAQTIAEHLQKAIYQVMPTRNNLQGNGAIRRINTSGKNSGGTQL